MRLKQQLTAVKNVRLAEPLNGKVEFAMKNVRVKYIKKGRSKYISHLDMNRCMTRALQCAKLPIWHTEGFNPHPYVTFALALSLGFESSCEIMDFNLNEGVAFAKVKRALNDVMPEGIQILSVITPQRKVTDIAKTFTAEDLQGELIIKRGKKNFRKINFVG